MISTRNYFDKLLSQYTRTHTSRIHYRMHGNVQVLICDFFPTRNSVHRCHGQLGHNSTSNETAPKRVPREYFASTNPSQNSVVIMAACGYYHTAAINEIGELFMWGNNSGGQLGLNSKVRLVRESQRVWSACPFQTIFSIVWIDFYEKQPMPLSTLCPCPCVILYTPSSCLSTNNLTMNLEFMPRAAEMMTITIMMNQDNTMRPKRLRPSCFETSTAAAAHRKSYFGGLGGTSAADRLSEVS